MEMRQTTCQKFETTNCYFQEGELYKVLCECTLIQEELTGVFCGIRMREGRITGGIFKPAWKECIDNTDLHKEEKWR